MSAADEIDDADGSLRIGGDKGHNVEIISGHLLRIYKSYRWKMIPRCTGRYTCRDHALVSSLPPLEVLSKVGITHEEQTLSSAGVVPGRPRPLQQYVLDGISGKDRILVVPLDENMTVGLICYVKHFKKTNANVPTEDDGFGSNTTPRYVHTLNAPSGFRRKLEAIGASVTDNGISFMG